MPKDDVRNQALFPITLWPETPIPAVPVVRQRLLNHDPSGRDSIPAVKGVTSSSTRLEWQFDPRLPPEDLPDEFVLRQLVQVDLDSDADVLDLLKFGALWYPYFLPANIPEGRRALLRPVSPDDRLWPRWWEDRRYEYITLEDARWWLKTARAMVDLYLATVKGEDPLPAWRNQGFQTLLRAETVSETLTSSTLWRLFAVSLDVGLADFHVHAQYLAKVDDEVASVGAPSANLYSGSCRQIFNLLVDDETLRRCQKTGCKIWFVHRVNRGKVASQRRSTGVKYCSDACARAEAQRNLRMRAIATKAGEN